MTQAYEVRPDDIPQSVWERALTTWAEMLTVSRTQTSWNKHTFNDVESIALAILNGGRPHDPNAPHSPLEAELHAALDEYVTALVERQNGYTAQNKAFDRICRALGRNTTHEMDQMRLSKAQPQ